MREKICKEGTEKTRDGLTWHFVIHAPHEDDLEAHVEVPRLVEVDGYLMTGEYKDGRLGEIFIRIGKAGSSAVWADQFAELFSLCLQNGEDVDDLCGRFTNAKFWPYGGVTSVEGIYRCTSLTDLICRYLGKKYGKKVDQS